MSYQPIGRFKSNYFWDGIFCLVSNRNFFQQIPQLWIIEDDWRSEDAIKRRSQLTPCAIKCFQWEKFWKFEWWPCWVEDVTSSERIVIIIHFTWETVTQSNLTNTHHPLLSSTVLCTVRTRPWYSNVNYTGLRLSYLFSWCFNLSPDYERFKANHPLESLYQK